MMKRAMVALMGLLVMAGSLQAAKLVTDSLPGLPGQSDVYWSERRQEQAEPQKGQGQFVNLREVAVKQDVTYQENEPVNFYTGKPYDAELGTYVFKFRNYNPETARWNTADPSGFPDGANNYCYTAIPSYRLDPLGLVTISSFEQAVEYYRRENGNTSDTVTLGDNVIADIMNSSAYQNNLKNLRTAVENQLKGVNKDASFGIELRDEKGLALGFVDAVIGRSSVYYSVMTPWTGGAWSGDPLTRIVSGYATMFCSVNEVWDFESHAGDSWFTDLLEEILPGAIIGPGTPFNLVASFQDGFNVSVKQYE